MRKEYWFYIILFLVGIWAAQIMGKEYFATYGYLDFYSMDNFVKTELNYVDLFWFILWTRGKQFLTIWILQLTFLKRILPLLLKLLFTFLTGFVLMVACMMVGSMGVLLIMGAIFPHGICYLMALLEMLGWRRTRSLDRKRNARWVVFEAGICVLLIISGSILETIVGTRILKYIIKVSKY